MHSAWVDDFAAFTDPKRGKMEDCGAQTNVCGGLAPLNSNRIVVQTSMAVTEPLHVTENKKYQKRCPLH